MRIKILLLLILTSVTGILLAQRQSIETDIFGDLKYRSDDGGYHATLKKNIFDDLIFSDNKRNEITYEKKYLQREYGDNLLSNTQQKNAFFARLIRENQRSEGYKAKYRIDIFDKLIVEDNAGYKLEEGRDIFGGIERREQFNGVQSNLKRSLNGTLEYNAGRDRATLAKDIFNKRTYKDSAGNEITYEEKTWSRFVQRFYSEEDAFMSLVDQYLR